MLSSHSAIEIGGELLSDRSRRNGSLEVLDAWFGRWQDKAADVVETDYLWSLGGMGGSGLEHAANRTVMPNASLFKVMASSGSNGDDVADLFRKLDAECAQVVFLWRRNVLRRYVSVKANHADRTSSRAQTTEGRHEAHPADHDQLARARDHRLELLTGRALIAHLEGIIKPRKEYVRAWQDVLLESSSRNKQHHLLPLELYYEDLIRSSATYDESWAQIQRFLQLEPQNLTTDLLQIHDEAEIPLNYTIRNYKAVAQTLRHTPLAYTLEDR